MEIVIIAVSIVAAFLIGRAIKNRKSSFLYTVYERAGIRSDLGLEELLSRLENAMPESYAAHVKKRVIGEGQIREEDYDYYEMELKRFFLLSTILKEVPMYSEKVDEIWHAMLMFTREYERFCEDYKGNMIHHAPSVGNTTEERAFFEWVYGRLFLTNEGTHRTYGRFFQQPLSKIIIENFNELSHDELKETYFQTYTSEEAANVIDLLIPKLQYDIQHVKGGDYKKRSNYFQDTDPNTMIPLMILYSDTCYTNDQYCERMNDHSPSHTSTHHHDHHHSCSGHSCSSHSCSSGSSCSSSSCGSSS
ncbi:hypothetical protein ACQKJC_01275 [Priestia koreensis]|uniref:hypothetical protein n=1 Tax=Priestia koreensis TaxID=284581 RepID=UPI003D068D45